MRQESAKLLACEFDTWLWAIKFSAEFSGVPGKGVMPIVELVNTIGKPVAPAAYAREFRNAVREGFIDLCQYRMAGELLPQDPVGAAENRARA
jgi:hypothetical protein